MRQRILVVAKDVALRGRIARALKSGGYGVELAEDAAHARRIGLKGFALSLVAPDGLGPDAKSLASELETNSAKPLLIGAEGPDGFRFSGDADLLARVAEALGRPVTEADAPEPALRFDRYRLDVAGYALTDNTGHAIPLTRGEFSLLREFVRRPGRVLSRDQLLQSLAGRDAESYDRSIDMLIVRLRRKIEADPKRPSLIVTIPGLGYKFTVKVTEASVAEPVRAADSKPEPVAAVSSAPLSPERRQLTILQVGLSGPGFVALRRDPEDLQRVLTAFHEHCQAIIGKAGGTIDPLLKDGVLAYFGYPQADEHQAEQAVRAALRLIETTEGLDTGQAGRLQSRIGIATGLAVVGVSLGGSSALGEAASIAAGLSGRAGPDSVLIAESTRLLVGGLFEVRAHEPIALDDAAEPVEAWVVTGEGTAESRFEALRGAALAPLIGREEELALLLKRWDQAKSGSGKMVLISGEPGIGKSRLTRAVQDAIVGQPHFELRFFCSPHHQDSALYPIMAQLEHAAGIAREDADESKLTKLDGMLAQSNASEPAVALIAELLSIATDQRGRLQQMSPQARRERTLTALLAQFTGLAARQPVLAVYEDLHWIDPSSRELLDRTVEALERLPVLLLATFRPDFQPQWTGQAHVTNLSLTRLDRHDTAAMIAGITGENGLSVKIAQEIGERTDGVPLFIEEMTKAVLESGPHATEALSSLPHPALAVPATLHASLIARLDRLGPAARDVAQQGAVIGREFRYELIAAIANRPEPELRDTLERLTSAGLLSARGTPPESTYAFKHALVQDAAYGTLLRSHRQQSHARIAAVFEQQSVELARTQPELLAFHYEKAGNPERSVPYWIAAGDVSERRGASLEAIAHYRSAHRQIGSDSSSAIRRREPEIGMKLGNALMQAEGYNSEAGRQAFERARSTAAQLDLAEEYARAGIGMSPLLFGQSRFREVLDIGESIASKLLNRLQPQTCVLLWIALGVAHYCIGELCTALEYATRAMRLDNEVRCTQENSAGGADPAVVSRAYAEMSSSALGLLEESVARSEEAWSIARESGHAFSIAWAGLIRLRSLVPLGRYAESIPIADECINICDQHGFSARLGNTLVYRGAARFGIGERLQGLADMRRGIALWRQTSGNFHVTQWISELVARLLQDGKADEADHALRDAEEIIEKTEERSHFAEIRRLRGVLCELKGEREQAGECYQRALEWARARQAKLFELRAATSLARLWRDQGKRAAARELLAPTYNWFTEGFDAPDLIEAKALLDELQPQSASAGRTPIAGRPTFGDA